MNADTESWIGLFVAITMALMAMSLALGALYGLYLFVTTVIL